MTPEERVAKVMREELGCISWYPFPIKYVSEVLEKMLVESVNDNPETYVLAGNQLGKDFSGAQLIVEHLENAGCDDFVVVDVSRAVQDKDMKHD